MNPLVTDVDRQDGPKPVIVALDFADAAATLQFVRKLSPDLCQLKVGKELFTADGRVLTEQLIMQGYRVFLDLKYHDIPNTVAAACKVAAEMGVWMVDVHASGGRRMMEAAVEAIAGYRNRPHLIGVTVLTSMTQQELQETGVDETVEEHVLRLAELARSSGLDGVVCSPWETRLLRVQLGDDFLLVTPGIRPQPPEGSDDQRRITTPKEALEGGSSYLVMGRPVTRSEDPVSLLRQVNNGAV